MAKNNLTVRKGQCINFGNCNKANPQEIIPINIGDDFICPECEGNLIEVVKKSFPKGIIIAVVAVFLVAGLGVGGYFLYPTIKEKFFGEKIKLPQPDEIDHPVTPAGITLDRTSLSLQTIGDTAQLAATVMPENTDEKNKEIIWQSSVDAVAIVSSTGLVTAVSSGNVVISAYTGNGISATCYVTVGDGTMDSNNNGNTVEIGEIIIIDTDSDEPNVDEYADIQEQEGQSVQRTPGQIDQMQQPITQKSAVKSYNFGEYVGSLKDGIPEGNGKLTYSRRVQIAKHDTDNLPHYAEAGDYFDGSWGNGDIVSGYLYSSDGSIKETIRAPKRFNPYDISKD